MKNQDEALRNWTSTRWKNITRYRMTMNRNIKSKTNCSGITLRFVPLRIAAPCTQHVLTVANNLAPLHTVLFPSVYSVPIVVIAISIQHSWIFSLLLFLVSCFEFFLFSSRARSTFGVLSNESTTVPSVSLRSFSAPLACFRYTAGTRF